MGKADLAWLDGLRRRHFPPERNQLPAHLTMFHHLPPSIGDEVNRRLTQATRGRKRPAAALSGVFNLGRGVAFRIDCPELDAIRGDLTDALAGLLTPQDAAPWRAHVTIQNKVTPDVARALHAELAAGFVSREITITGLASWYYRGGPWEARSRHMFA